jgi:hypothetical protein
MKNKNNQQHNNNHSVHNNNIDDNNNNLLDQHAASGCRLSGLIRTNRWRQLKSLACNERISEILQQNI